MRRLLSSFGFQVAAGVAGIAVVVALFAGSGTYLPSAAQARPTPPTTATMAPNPRLSDTRYGPVPRGFLEDADSVCDEAARPSGCDIVAPSQIGPYGFTPIEHLDGALTETEARDLMSLPEPRPYTAVQGFLVRATTTLPGVVDRPAWLFVAIGPCDLVGFRPSGGPMGRHEALADPTVPCMEGYLGDAFTGARLAAASGPAILPPQETFN